LVVALVVAAMAMVEVVIKTEEGEKGEKAMARVEKVAAEEAMVMVLAEKEETMGAVPAGGVLMAGRTAMWKSKSRAQLLIYIGLHQVPVVQPTLHLCLHNQ